MPGDVQTVARGELFAFVLLLRHLVDNSEAEFVTDNLNVHETFVKGPQSAVNSANCDLFEEVFEHIRVKNLNITTRWMPSHLSEGKKVRPPEVTDRDIECNDHADNLANIAAAKASLSIPRPIATNIIYYSSLVVRIQKRLANIIMHLPAREHNDIKPPSNSVAKISIDELLCSTKHSISRSGNRFFCVACKNNFRKDDPGLRPWLSSSCSLHNPRDYHKPIRVTEAIHIGNSTSHHSHSLYNYRGVIYCNKCGYFGVKQFQHLAKQCQAPKLAGIRFLNCIEKGLMPVGISEWPETNVP